MKAILEGYRVLDLSQLVAGPLAAASLVDLGADVIKVEPPAGDKCRMLGEERFAPDCGVPRQISQANVAPDGLAYTFHLRHGVKFHNGREMKAADVKYSLERTCNPKTQSPGSGYYGSIKGFDEEQAGKTTELSGVTTPDDYTVKLQLTSPNATMLHIMALNFSFVVPKEEVDKYGADFGKHPVQLLLRAHQRMHMLDRHDPRILGGGGPRDRDQRFSGRIGDQVQVKIAGRGHHQDADNLSINGEKAMPEPVRQES